MQKGAKQGLIQKFLSYIKSVWVGRRGGGVELQKISQCRWWFEAILMPKTFFDEVEVSHTSKTYLIAWTG